MDQPFAIITFRDSGPIKTWSDMRGANVHNSRLKPIEHGIPGAPPPRHLIGGRDLVADVKRRLEHAGIDPKRLRKNGVIAFEAVMTASPQFFEAGDVAAPEVRLEAWVQAQKAFALKRWGAHRVASMVLHLDEKTPHIHLIVLPLEVKSDKRRVDPDDLRWSLVGRTISGPGRFDQLQDEYAEAMATFGLCRGIRGSGRKHIPMAVYLAQLANREAGIERAESVVAIDRSAADRDRKSLDAARDAFDAERAQQRRAVAEQAERLREVERFLMRERAQLDRERAEGERARKKRDQAAQAQREALTTLAEQIERDRRAVAEERQLVAREAAANREFRAELADFRERLKPIVEAANFFIRKSAGVDPMELAPQAREARSAALQVAKVTAAATRPASNDGPSAAQQATYLAQQGIGR